VSQTVQLGIPGLSPDEGDHVCAFYRGGAERDGILRAYLAAGLRCGDKCVCVLDDADPDQLLASLDTEVPGRPDEHQLDVRISHDTYLMGGLFSTSAMLAFWGDVVGAAMAGGYHFSRAVGEMTWALRQMPGVDELVAYESELNDFLPKHPQVILCLYDLERFSGSILVDVLKTHPKVLIGGMVLDNPYYLEPARFLAARR
jgi:hypothetical protein